MLLLATATAASAGGCAAPPELRSAEPDVRIVAFGDSATRGPAGADYPSMLPGLLGIPAEAVANEGVPGETTDAGLRRLGVLIDRAIFPNAAVLICWQGGTDLIDFVAASDPQLGHFGDDPDTQLESELDQEFARIEENLTAAVARGRAAGWTVYLVTYYPLAPDVPCPLLPSEAISPEDAPAMNAYVEALNDRIRAAAASAGAMVIDVADLGEALLADPGNYFDCNHLSAAGNVRVAALVATAIGS